MNTTKLIKNEKENEVINNFNSIDMAVLNDEVATPTADEKRKAAPAASVNPVIKSKMKVTTIEALQAEGKQIVFLAFNRDVTDKTPHVKRLAKSIKVEGLHTPLHLVPATTAINEGVMLLDENGSAVTDGANKYALVDGNNKYRAIQVLRATQEPGMAVAPINCIIDEEAKEIQKMVMTINNVVKPWSNADAIKAASRTKDDEVADFIAEKVKEGFTFSTLSLILTGYNNKITKSIVMNFIADTGELPDCDLAIAKKKLTAMKEAGFSDKFIKNRYLIETINGLVFQGHNLDNVLAALKTYTDDEVQFAQDRRSLALLKTKVEEIEAA